MVKGRTTLLIKYVFSQDDIDIALDWIFTRFFAILKNESSEDKTQSTSHRMKRLEDFISVINTIGLIYCREIQVCRFFWHA